MSSRRGIAPVTISPWTVHSAEPPALPSCCKRRSFPFFEAIASAIPTTARLSSHANDVATLEVLPKEMSISPGAIGACMESCPESRPVLVAFQMRTRPSESPSSVLGLTAQRYASRYAGGGSSERVAGTGLEPARAKLSSTNAAENISRPL